MRGFESLPAARKQDQRLEITMKLERRFGRCPVKGCKYHRVVEGSYVNGVLIHYNGINRNDLRSIGAWCEEHNKHLTWNQLKGRTSSGKECNGVCMGAVGPSCDCSCGGENHGKNHI
jgi:hypothetical protein